MRNSQLVLRGNRPKDLSRVKKLMGLQGEVGFLHAASISGVLNFPFQPPSAQCLCLFLGTRWPWSAVYLIAFNSDVVDIWYTGLTKLVTYFHKQPCPRSSDSSVTPINYWLQRIYATLKQQQERDALGLHAIVALGHFAKLRLWSAFKVLVACLV